MSFHVISSFRIQHVSILVATIRWASDASTLNVEVEEQDAELYTWIWVTSWATCFNSSILLYNTSHSTLPYNMICDVYTIYIIDIQTMVSSSKTASN